MAASVQAKTKNPKIKTPSPVKIKNNSVATQSKTIVATATPQIAPVTAMVMPSRGSIKCQATIKASIINKVDKMAMLIRLFFLTGVCVMGSNLAFDGIQFFLVRPLLRAFC